MAASGRFDGHIVQGHVDGVGTVQSIKGEGEARRLRIAIPPTLAKYVVEKGSITVDGVSLTITAVGTEPWFEIVLIPHTLDVTVLGHRDVGDLVNLEMDVLAKYVERLMNK
jgi:riboflavin synthase